MPLFECSQCHAVDNTALTGFWWNVMHDKKPALCSECDPKIGKWHGKFPKTATAEYLSRFGPKSVQYQIIDGKTVDVGYASSREGQK